MPVGQEIAESTDPMQGFQNRVLQKIRDDIGKMLPDEVVEGLVQRAIDEEFFRPVKVYSQYGNDKEEPSWFIKEVTKLSKPVLEKYIAEHVKEREKDIKKVIDEFLTTQRLQLITLAAMQSATRQDIAEIVGTILAQLKSHGF